MRLRSCLKAGDVVELGIDGLGESRQKLLAYEAAEAVYARP
jgi:2-keto-4-pentenoate hydratase/2-oxohepta-3-ene-1,7-dioic acid hydratase in catechol pathway